LASKIRQSYLGDGVLELLDDLVNVVHVVERLLLRRGVQLGVAQLLRESADLQHSEKQKCNSRK
jgi:hypothetical protein